jgi:hypothetical protein
LESLVEVVASDIERYCIAHPEACDTAEGIFWWVQLQRQDDIRSSVAGAIALLLSKGVLQCSFAPDGTELFGRSATPTNQ